MKLQTTDISCGPIAIINAYYDLFGKYPSLTERKLMNICNTSEKNGTFRWDIRENSIISMDRGTYKIDKIMQMDRCILLYSFLETYAHYVYVKKISRNRYKIFNYYDPIMDKYRHLELNSRQYRELLQFNPRVEDLYYPLGWHIKK